MERAVQTVLDVGRGASALKPGGLFFHNTINRTLASKIAVLKVMQEWPSTAFATLTERKVMLDHAGLAKQDMRDLAPGVAFATVREAPLRTANWGLDFSSARPAVSARPTWATH